MTVYFLLYIILQSDFSPDRVELGGRREYASLEDCRGDAQNVTNWLTQPDVRVLFKCERHERRAKSAEGLG
jgi:hypothetical protein